MTPDPLEFFTFGYWGWGNATAQLVELVDRVERSRGREPPLFVDVRLHRKVRAIGFKDDAFAACLGEGRYRWMPELGNRNAPQQANDPGLPNSIARPEAAEALLDLVRTATARGVA